MGEVYVVMSLEEGYDEVHESYYVECRNFYGICDSLDTARSLVRNLIEEFRERNNEIEDFEMGDVSYEERITYDNDTQLAEFDYSSVYVTNESMTYYVIKTNILTERDM